MSERQLLVRKNGQIGNSWFDVTEPITEQEIVRPYLDKLKAEVKKWYWDKDVQQLAKDPCVVDAMTSMFISMINNLLSNENERNE